jgi:hypothetical protein
MHSAACNYCEFRDRCDRGHILTSDAPSNIEDIPEIII